MQVNPLYVALASTTFFGTMAAFYLTAMRPARATTQRFREVVLRRREIEREPPRTRDFGKRLLANVHRLRVTLGLSESDEVPKRLANAGYRGPLAADIYNAARFVLPLLGLIVALLIPFMQMLWVTALPAVGFIAPNII